MFNAISLVVNRIIDLDAVDYKVVPVFFSYNPRITAAFVWLGTAVIRGRRLDQEVKIDKKWPWLIGTAIHGKLRMVLHANYVKSSGVSRGGEAPLYLDQTEARRAPKTFFGILFGIFWNYDDHTDTLPPYSPLLFSGSFGELSAYMYMINHTSVWTMWILQSLWWMSVQGAQLTNLYN